MPCKGGVLETRYVVIKDGTIQLYNIGLRKVNPMVDRPEYTTSLKNLLEVKVHDQTQDSFPFTLYFRDPGTGKKISLSFITGSDIMRTRWVDMVVSSNPFRFI